MTPLQQAAQQVIEQWDAPLWKNTISTAHFIAELRKALEAEQAQMGEPVAWVRENELADLLSCNGRSIWAESPSIWFDEVPEHLVPVYKNPYLRPEAEQTQAVEPFEIEFPDYHGQAMRYGLEDRNITDRYEAMRYGWDQALERVEDCLPEKLYTHPAPPPAMGERAVEPESQWPTKAAIDALKRFEETCSDGEGYDVPKDAMRALQAVGLVYRTRGNVYATTDFGNRVLAGRFFNQPAPPVEQAQAVEPVATVQCINGVTIGYLDVMQPVGTKLYLHPVQTPAEPTVKQSLMVHASAEDYMRYKYGAYRGHFAWRELEEAYSQGRYDELQAQGPIQWPDDAPEVHYQRGYAVALSDAEEAIDDECRERVVTASDCIEIIRNLGAETEATE